MIIEKNHEFKILFHLDIILKLSDYLIIDYIFYLNILNKIYNHTIYYLFIFSFH